MTLGKSTVEGFRIVSLTAVGEMFVQPELAEFGTEPMFPLMVKSVEDRIDILTYSQEEKDSMRYRLREAVAKQAPDFMAKVFAEIAYRVFGGTGS